MLRIVVVGDADERVVGYVEATLVLRKIIGQGVVCLLRRRERTAVDGMQHRQRTVRVGVCHLQRAAQGLSLPTVAGSESQGQEQYQYDG